MINWMKYKGVYFLVSGIMIVISVLSLWKWGMNLGVDFKGGSILEYKLEQKISIEEIKRRIEEDGVEITSIQQMSDGTYLFRMPPIEKENKDKIRAVLEETAGSVDELRFENVGPAVGPELVKKTIYAIAISAGIILLWVAYQFKSIKFGASAILAMFHDSFILIGSFSLLGHFFAAEVDFLFVTALLTTLSFSVHDTIVVFDRIREIKKRESGSLIEISNRALTETMVRSLNNSFTIIFMLAALLLLGGTTVRWFAGALLVGTILGTYSSPFVAVPFLVTWDKVTRKVKK